MAKQQLTPRLNKFEPNIVIDGTHEIWPEGTSRNVGNNTNAYGAVLFNLENSSTAVTLVNSQQGSIPSGTNISFSNQVSKTAGGTLAAGTVAQLKYSIEGYDLQKIWNDSFSIIFWVKSTVASNRSVSLRSTNATFSYVKQYNISAANTWQLKVLTFPAMSTCPDTVDRANGLGVLVRWAAVAGSTWQTSTLNAWQSGNFTSGTGEDTTWLTGTTHDFSIAGVMILPGDWTYLTSNTSAYNFVRAGRTFADEVMFSQRYYEKSYQLATSPATTISTGTLSVNASGTLNGSVSLHPQLKSRKRASPTIVTYSDQTGTTGQMVNASGNTDLATSVSTISEYGFRITNGAASTDQNIYRVHWTADARF